MKPGDRVTTPCGPGTVAGFEEHQGWRRIGVNLDKPLWHGNPAWFFPRDHITPTESLAHV